MTGLLILSGGILIIASILTVLNEPAMTGLIILLDGLVIIAGILTFLATRKQT